MKDSGKGKGQLIRKVRTLRRRITELEVSERGARVCEELFRMLIQTIPDIIYLLDSRGRFVFVNKAIRQLGYEPNKLIGKYFGDVLHPDDVKVLSRLKVLPKYKGRTTGDAGSPKLFDERRTGKRCTKNLEARMLLKGKGKTSSDYCSAEIHSCGEWGGDVQSKHKKFLGSLGIIRDITERKKAEEKIARLASFPEQNLNPVCEVDLTGRVLYANPAARRLFPGLLTAGSKHPWLADFRSAVVPAIWAKEERRFSRQISVGGIWYLQTMYYISGPPRLRIYGTDITDRKRAESAEQHKRFSNMLIKVQEEERKRVAQELHDGIGQILTAIKLTLGMIEKDHPDLEETVQHELKEAVRFVEEGLQDTHRISNGLRPAMLDHFGLIPCIEHEINRIASRSGLEIKFTWKQPHCRLISQKEIALYRVTQEALTNIVKHAKAAKANISIRQRDNKVLLKIQDNGRGFNLAEVKGSYRLGLLGMRERIASVGGTLRISSIPDKGTLLEAEVPC